MTTTRRPRVIRLQRYIMPSVVSAKFWTVFRDSDVDFKQAQRSERIIRCF